MAVAREGVPEEKFKTFVGKRVEVSGMQKKAKVAASGQPTGGSSIGSDLKLFEVEVSSVKAAVVTTAQVQRSETSVQAPGHDRTCAGTSTRTCTDGDSPAARSAAASADQ